MLRRAEATCLACSLLALATAAHAAHPFITDDAYTQGSGKFELQLGSQYTRTDVEGVTLADFQFAPQLSYGMADPIDLILRPTYSVNVASGGASSRASGWGDTNFVILGFSGSSPERAFPRAISTVAWIPAAARRAPI